MFKSSQMMPLFAVPVWAQQLEDETAESMNAHLLEQVAVLKAELPGILKPDQGWQTRTDLHELEEFAGMTEIIREASGRVLEFMKVEPAPFEITGCWMNIKPGGTGHILHDHPNNYLSGVYYVKAPRNADTITFHDMRLDRHVIMPRFSEQTPINMQLTRVPVATGVLIMFPAWLPHSVEPNPTTEERVSLSFNIMFSDFEKTHSRPSWDWAAEEMGQSVNSRNN